MADSEAALILSQRVFACEMIQKMGILLRLPQVAVSTAQVSFHRFYAKRSMRKFDVKARGNAPPPARFAPCSASPPRCAHAC
jgi:hypothetical protein